jgi:hypothetical protein
VRLLPDAHGLFDAGGLHGGMVLHDHVAIERQGLFHCAGKAGGRPVHLLIRPLTSVMTPQSAFQVAEGWIDALTRRFGGMLATACR